MVTLGPSDHKAIAEDLLYAAFWLARSQRRSRNLKMSRFMAGDVDSTTASVRETYGQGLATRLYTAYLFNVDPDDVLKVTRHMTGYEEDFPEEFKRGLARAEEEVRKAEIP